MVPEYRAFSEPFVPDALDEANRSVFSAAVFTSFYHVKEGDTLGGIAQQFGVSPESIFWCNGMDVDGLLATGRELRIPRFSGIPYVVNEGDTLADIAERFGVAEQAITLFRGNGFASSPDVQPGRELFIPGGTLPLPESLAAVGGVAEIQAVKAAAVIDDQTSLREGPGKDYKRIGVLSAATNLELLGRNENWIRIGSNGTIGWVRADLLNISEDVISTLPVSNDFVPPPPVWVWPARGTVTSIFGYRSYPFRSFHNGLDIANGAGTKIVAARSGRVTEAGWCRGYGYCVRIDHGDGMLTIYGHLLKKPVVVAGEKVEAGDMIGLMGSTFDRSGGGYSTGVHLHLTVMLNGKAVDPLKFLP